MKRKKVASGKGKEEAGKGKAAGDKKGEGGGVV